MQKAHVKVDEEVRSRLKSLKDRFGLTFNDLISMALTFLEREETKIFIEADIARIVVNVKKAHLDSSFTKTLIEKGYDIFIPKINIRQANYFKRKLKAELNLAITVHPVVVAKEEGYLLMFSKT